MDVSPDKQNLDQVFANTTYYIDFYQRQYKWDDSVQDKNFNKLNLKINS